MFTTQAEVTIDRPIEDVYDFLADARNDLAWCPPVTAVELVEDRGDRRRYRARAKPGPRTLTNDYELVEADRPRRITFEGGNQMADFDGHYELEPSEAGTRVRVVSRLDVHGFMRALGPIIERMSARNATVQVARLKAVLEHDGAPAGPTPGRDRA